MDINDLWNEIKEIFVDIVKYGFPTAALILSFLSYLDSSKSTKIKKRLSEIEEKLKQYELEEKEKARAEETMACVEVRIVHIANFNYRLKVWNSGKVRAFNVDFKIPDDFKGVIFRDKVPLEFLDPGKSFEEGMIVYDGTPRKFCVTTSWEDKYGKSYINEQIVTF